MTAKTASTLGVLILAAGAAMYAGRRYLMTHALSSNASIAGVGGKILPGRTYVQREKLHSLMKQSELLSSLGEPTYRYETRGDGVHAQWIYEYADGKMVVSITGGYVVQIETTFK